MSKRHAFDIKMLTRGDGRRVYEVLRNGRRWVATHHVTQRYWMIENEYRTRIDPNGELGWDIIESCEEAFARMEEAA